MNKFVALFATLALALAGCSAEYIVTYAKEDGTIVTEDLEAPSTKASTAVDPSKLRFLLYTKNNQNTPQELRINDPDGLRQSNFDPSKPCKIIIHGWNGNYNGSAIRPVREALVASLDVMALMFDWEAYNSPYSDSVQWAKPIASHFAQFLDYLVNNGLRIKDVHIIGHSLGAHIAAFTSNAVKSGTIPRITGMDPAGPSFQKATAADRLSPEDASFVDVLHTSTLFGYPGALGHCDFYPNGGSNQPDCKGLLGGGCDHTEACTYYARSLTNPKAFPALICKTEKDARIATPSPDACVKSQAYMGEPALATASPGIYNVPF